MPYPAVACDPLTTGAAIRILHDRLPSLLLSPLPQDILAPRIQLKLFPSTHPHLPTVHGKIAYTAALWTAPVAWGKVPVVGNVKLAILSERLTQHGLEFNAEGFANEKLMVKWKTRGKPAQALRSIDGDATSADRISSLIRRAAGRNTTQEEDFCGRFIFQFDGQGRIASHTIEHVEEGGCCDKPARVISVTDWLLGRAWGKECEEVVPEAVMVKNERQAPRPRRVE